METRNTFNSKRAEVIIVGGGVIGLSIARALKQRGVRDLILIERGEPGAEASWAAGGILAPQVEADRPDEFFRLACASRDLYPEFAEALREETGIDVELDKHGTLYLGFTDSEEHEMRRRHDWQTKAGLQIDWLTGEEARALEPNISPKVRSALRFPNDYQVENRRLVQALVASLQKSGVNLLTNCEVSSVRIEHDRVTGVDTASGAFSAPTVIVAAGAWTAQITHADAQIDPVRGQMLCFAAPQIASHVIYSARGYLVPRRDGRLLAGSTSESVGFDKRVTNEGVQSINGLITNDMKTLELNFWMPAAFANVQGRLLAAVRVIRRDDGFVIDTENATAKTVAKLLERFTFAGDFHLKDLAEVMQLSIQGESASRILGQVLGEDLSSLSRTAVALIAWQNEQTTIIRSTHSAEDGFDLFIARAAGESLRDALVAAGAKALSDDINEVLRIEAGIPRYGVDMDESNVVTETNLEDAVSFTKGCYVGQEIIVRIKHRGHVAKKLTGITLEKETTIARGAKILSPDEKEVGRVTSSTFSPRLGRTIALGYLKYDYLAPGTSVRIDDVPAKVSEIPFVRGSWY